MEETSTNVVPETTTSYEHEERYPHEVKYEKDIIS